MLVLLQIARNEVLDWKLRDDAVGYGVAYSKKKLLFPCFLKIFEFKFQIFEFYTILSPTL